MFLGVLLCFLFLYGLVFNFQFDFVAMILLQFRSAVFTFHDKFYENNIKI